MTSKNNKAHLLCHFKFCASFRSHPWIEAGVTVRKCSVRIKFGDFVAPCYLEIRRMTLKSNRASLLHYFKLCASFRSHLWIKTGVRVRKPPNWGSICFDLCDLDLWPLTWTFCMDITSINGNNSMHDNTMTGTWGKRFDGETGGLNQS